jgi:hypothetical protein
MTANQAGPWGVFNPNTQTVGFGVNQGGAPIITCPAISSWPMNEGSGLVLNDTSGSANTANIDNAGAVTWGSNSGFPGTTPLWNGTAGAAASNTVITAFDGTTPFTISLWMHPNNTSGAALMSTFATLANFAGWEVTYNGSPATISFFLVNNLGVNYIQVAGSLVVSGAGPHYVVVTYDGTKTAAGVKIYVDGVKDTNIVTSDTLTLNPASSIPVHFGERQNSTANFTGPMAFCEVFPCVLNQAAITANFAFGPAIR